jgi:ANTAR domain/GAF domain
MDNELGIAPRGMAAASQALCHRFVTLLPVSGASISISGASGGQSTIGITDPVAARLEQLQFELGEGPHWEALESGRPVLVSDVRRANSSTWPMLRSAIIGLDVGAIFAIPLTMGAVTVGAVDLYRSTPGPLQPTDLAAGVALAESISAEALRYAIESAEENAERETSMAPAMRREVHQATGIIFVQLGISASEAFARLQARAFADGRPLADVALDVVQRKLDFRDTDEYLP